MPPTLTMRGEDPRSKPALVQPSICRLAWPAPRARPILCSNITRQPPRAAASNSYTIAVVPSATNPGSCAWRNRRYRTRPTPAYRLQGARPSRRCRRVQDLITQGTSTPSASPSGAIEPSSSEPWIAGIVVVGALLPGNTMTSRPST